MQCSSVPAACGHVRLQLHPRQRFNKAAAALPYLDQKEGREKAPSWSMSGAAEALADMASSATCGTWGRGRQVQGRHQHVPGAVRAAATLAPATQLHGAFRQQLPPAPLPHSTSSMAHLDEVLGALPNVRNPAGCRVDPAQAWFGNA